MVSSTEDVINMLYYVIALLSGQWTCNSQVADSCPVSAPLCSGLGQATYLHLCASVTKQYNLVPAKGGGGDLFGWESNRGPGGK